jgi:Zn finger protein HypA/HybF involved in hydrogenase expression
LATIESLVIEITLKEQLTSSIFDPSPHRLIPNSISVSERRIPIRYKCRKCEAVIDFKTSSFEKNCKSSFSNLNPADNDKFNQYINNQDLVNLSFLDFFCPKCSQPTKFLFEGGRSGYWGEFALKIRAILLLKDSK